MRPEAATWMRLARVYGKFDRGMAEQLRGWGLSPAQFDVLAHVGAAEGRTQQELADALLTTKGNVCHLLDRMEAAGLLRRAHDGRANRLFLTEAGRRLWDQVVPAHEAWIADRFGILSPEERAMLGRVLRRLDQRLP